MLKWLNWIEPFTNLNLHIMLEKENRQQSKGTTMSKHHGHPKHNGSPSIEVNLFNKMMGFYRQIVARLREESLDEEQQQLVLDRLNALIQNEVEEMKQTQELNVAERLHWVSEQINQFIDELAESE